MTARGEREEEKAVRREGSEGSECTMEIGTSDGGCGSKSHLQPPGDWLAHGVGLAPEPEENLLGTLPSSLNAGSRTRQGQLRRAQDRNQGRFEGQMVGQGKSLQRLGGAGVWCPGWRNRMCS